VHDVSVHETLGALSRELEVELLRSRLLSRLVQHGNLEEEEKASASSARLSKRVWDFGIERERERETGGGVKGGRTHAQERIWIPRLACPARPNPTHPVVPAVRLPRRPAPWSRSCTRPAWPLARRARHTPAAFPRMKFAPPWSMLLYVLALLARGNQRATLRPLRSRVRGGLKKLFVAATG